MTAARRVRQGFLVIADVSGYTPFLAGTELEHAQAIMEEVTKLLLDHVRPPLKLVKLEGDAVFYYAPAEALPEGERLLDHIEACYFDFSSHLQNMQRSTTCPCAACASMQTLDLKFLAHFGEYIVQRLVGTAEDLAGPDVILLHRLLKNRVTERTGLGAYALLTDACMQRTGRPASIVAHTESCEHLGEIHAGVHDLRAVERVMREAHRVYVEPAEADITYERVVRATPEVLWSFNVDPVRRLLWQQGLSSVTNTPNSAGRFGSGAVMHCAHGASGRIAQILDWRPFHYFTVRCDFRPAWMGPPNWATFEFLPIDGGRTRAAFRVHSLRRDWFTMQCLRVLIGPMVRKEFDASYHRLDKILAEMSSNDTDG